MTRPPPRRKGKISSFGERSEGSSLENRIKSELGNLETRTAIETNLESAVVGNKLPRTIAESVIKLVNETELDIDDAVLVTGYCRASELQSLYPRGKDVPSEKRRNMLGTLILTTKKRKKHGM